MVEEAGRFGTAIENKVFLPAEQEKHAVILEKPFDLLYWRGSPVKTTQTTDCKEEPDPVTKLYIMGAASMPVDA